MTYGNVKSSVKNEGAGRVIKDDVRVNRIVLRTSMQGVFALVNLQGILQRLPAPQNAS